MSNLDSNWLELQWTPWIPFNSPRLNWLVLPNEPGLYRVRPKNSDFLVYIGETGLGLRERLNALRRGTMAELMRIKKNAFLKIAY
jgi:hypothetical protein